MKNLLILILILTSINQIDSQCYIKHCKANNLFWEIQDYEFVDFTGRVENKSTVIIGWNLFSVDSVDLLRSINESKWELINSTTNNYTSIIDQLCITGNIKYVLKMHIDDLIVFSQTISFKTYHSFKKPVVVYDNLKINIYYNGTKNIKMYMSSGTEICNSVVKIYEAELDISSLPGNNLYILNVNDNVYKIYK